MVKCHIAYTGRTRRVPQGVAVCAVVFGLAGSAAQAPDRGQTGLRNPTVTLGADDGRWAAATEILDFNGWDVSKLREIKG